MMDKKLLKVLNEQVTAEFFAAQLYLSMSAYYENKGLSGFANWMRIQFQEEQEHALKIYDYILSRGEDVELGGMEKPKCSWESENEVMKEALAHEQKVTSMINNIMDIAQDVKDYPTINLMNWFIDEQVEEEANVEYLISQLEYISSKGSILILDRELAQRTYQAPQ